MKELNQNTKEFIAYLKEHPEYRLYQAMRNFIQLKVNAKWNWLCVSDGQQTEDTFHWQ